MLVYKFGGGVLKNAEGIRKMAEVVSSKSGKPGNNNLVIVISALGKMTNAFEELWSNWIEERNTDDALVKIEEYHRNLCNDLFGEKPNSNDRTDLVFEELKTILKTSGFKNKNQAYDMIIPYGEILSSQIVSGFLQETGIEHKLVDARDIIITNSDYRNARVDYDMSLKRINKFIQTDQAADGSRIWLTQGFIGSDSDGNTTTLGREGSDFTAAILGSALDADSVIVWKDVPGIMTGDPERFTGVHKMDEVSYLEAIELSYFGAKVLHPNTIKPLQNKDIPLYVNSLERPEFNGTKVVKEPQIGFEKPVLIEKTNQVLISLQPRDFSFIMEEAVSKVFASLARYNLRVNLLQHGAVSMSFCVDYDESSINNLIGDLIPDYKVLYNTGLDLLTIRHYTEEVIEEYTKGRKIYVQQQSRRTARFILH